MHLRLDKYRADADGSNRNEATYVGGEWSLNHYRKAGNQIETTNRQSSATQRLWSNRGCLGISLYGPLALLELLRH